MVVVSLILGLGAAWVANNWVQSRLNTGDTSAKAEVPVVAASMDIPFGTKVDSRHLKLIELPPGSVPSNHFSSLAEVEGQIATQGILSGEILRKERFTEHLSGSTLAAIIKPNMRAVTVRVNDVIGVAGFLLPGNRVDVLASRLDNRRATTHTVLKDINVLAVDQKATSDKDEPVVVRAVTLEMTPKQAEELVKAREEGTIQLTLRNPLEEEPVLLAEEPKEAPAPKRVVVRAPQAPPTNTVTIIRGTNVAKTKTSS